MKGMMKPHNQTNQAKEIGMNPIFKERMPSLPESFFLSSSRIETETSYDRSNLQFSSQERKSQSANSDFLSTFISRKNENKRKVGTRT